MFYPRTYKCNRCGKKFVSSDGVIHLPSIGVECPHCHSRDTEEDYSGIKDLIKRLFGK